LSERSIYELCSKTAHTDSSASACRPTTSPEFEPPPPTSGRTSQAVGCTNGPALAAGCAAQNRPLLAALAYGCAKFPCLADDARKTALSKQIDAYLAAARIPRFLIPEVTIPKSADFGRRAADCGVSGQDPGPRTPAPRTAQHRVRRGTSGRRERTECFVQATRALLGQRSQGPQSLGASSETAKRTSTARSHEATVVIVIVGRGSAVGFAGISPGVPGLG